MTIFFHLLTSWFNIAYFNKWLKTGNNILQICNNVVVLRRTSWTIITKVQIGGSTHWSFCFGNINDSLQKEIFVSMVIQHAHSMENSSCIPQTKFIYIQNVYYSLSTIMYYLILANPFLCVLCLRKNMEILQHKLSLTPKENY